MVASSLIRDLFLQVLLLPLAAVVLLRAFFREGGWRAVSERLGGGPDLPPGPAIWLHGASNGELTSALPLIRAILARWPDVTLAITVNTLSARMLVTAWGDARIAATLAPVDLYPAVARFLTRVRPLALIVIENELWPQRLGLAAARGAPVFIASARMSAASARNWSRIAGPLGLTAAVMRAVTRVYPQDSLSAAHLARLGLAPDRIGPILNLKAAATATSGPTPAPLAFSRSDTILAASTHEGDEEVILDAFRLALAQRPGLHLILAPRHPRRRDQIEALLRARGLRHASRSRGAEPQADVPVYLADSMGEMARWYAAAAVTFVGGSLSDRGGHTPFEPAAAGSAILHGPDVANFTAAYTALAPDAALCVSDAPALATAFVNLTGSLEAAQMADRARQALAGLSASADLSPLLDDLAPYIARRAP